MASNKKILLIETDPNNVDRGKTFALDPADATGFAIPSIKMVDTLPTKGIVKGETVALKTDNSLYNWDGGQWNRLVGVGGTNTPVGAIATWPTSTPPAGWLLCDGSQFDENVFPELFALLGKNTTPNLSDQFIRGARNAQDVGVESPWSTAFKAAMKAHAGGRHDHGGNTSDAGEHQHRIEGKELRTSNVNNIGNQVNGANWAYEIAPGNRYQGITNRAGDHHHAIATEADHEHTLEGGDSETAPKHVRLYYIICASSTSALQSVQHTFLQPPVADAVRGTPPTASQAKAAPPQ